ncbi:MAG: Rnf-Nqr domain containing protein [Candidatus Porifericomitaceae bacterium WSBS_2022_MAG_OTU9]
MKQAGQSGRQLQPLPELVVVALCPLAIAATDAARGSLLGIVTALCLLLSVQLLNRLRGLVPAKLLLPLLLLLCCTSAFLLRLVALLSCYELAEDLYQVLPLAAVSSAIIMLLLDNDPNHGNVGMSSYAAWALALLLATGMLRGLLAYGSLYVPPGKVVADGLMPLFALPSGTYIILAILLACSHLWPQGKAQQQ